jgi:uncharacterized protein YcbK (DUF882 family)
MTQLTQHFLLSEFACRCGCSLPAGAQENLCRLALAMEDLRAEIKAPLTIVSGYRCVARNRKIGGARNSTHLRAIAVDMQARDFSGRDLRSVVERLIATGRIPDGGVGIYSDRPRTLHYDQRGMRVRWES